MSRFEIIGMSDCIWFAKAEKIADEIMANNPTMEFHRQLLDRFTWFDYIEKMKHHRGWDIKRSPVIFEVLVESDGKACLIGDIDDFCEFAMANFNILYNPTIETLKKLGKNNKQNYKQGFEGQDRGDASIFNLSIINAPIKTLEHLLSQLLSPVSMIPSGFLLNIRIFDEVTPSRMLDGLIMELVDCASPNLFKASITNSLSMLFYQCHLLLYMEDLSMEPLEEIKDWLTRVEMTVIKYFAPLSKAKSMKGKVIIGNEGPQCYVAEDVFGATIFRKMVPYDVVGYGHIVTAGQFVVQQAKCEISNLTGIPAGCINRIYAWGWPGLTGAYIEVDDAVSPGVTSIRGPGVEIPLAEIATNCDKLYNGFSKKNLKIQHQRIRKLVRSGAMNMVMADSVISAIQLWMKALFDRGEEGNRKLSTHPFYDPSNPQGCDYTPLPVISLGVQCCFTSSFPPGTFMVQPAICVDGIWRPLGKISEATHQKVQVEVSKLWKTRQEMIHRDKYEPGLCPDYDRMLADPRDYEEQTGETELPGEDPANYPSSENKPF